MVSVIIPVFNKKDTIAQCLDSILSNSYQDKEIIAVDDASADGSLEILRGYGKKGIVLIELDKHKGVAYACNAALAKARGDIIARTDADTVVPGDWLDRYAGHFNNKDVIAVGGSYGCGNEDSVIAFCSSCLDVIFNTIFKRMFSASKLVGANRAIRKDAIVAIGGFSEKHSGSEDIDLYLRLVNAGKIIYDSNICVQTAYPRGVFQLCRRFFLWGYAAGSEPGYFKHPPIWLRPVFFTGMYASFVMVSRILYLEHRWHPFWSAILAASALILVILIPLGLSIIRKKRMFILLLPACFLVQGTAYSLGFLTGCLKAVFHGQR